MHLYEMKVERPLGESGSPSAVNNTSLSFAIRDKKPQERGAE
jgi:hypothetical protein